MRAGRGRMIFYRPPGDFLRVVSATARFLPASIVRPCCARLAAVGARISSLSPEAEPVFKVGHGGCHDAVLGGRLMPSSPARLPASPRAKLGVDARFEHQAAIFTAFWPLAGRKHGLADSTTRLPVTKEARISRPLTCECPCARRTTTANFLKFPPAPQHPDRRVGPPSSPNSRKSK